MQTKELTPLAIGVGLVVAVVMTAATVYLGLYAGMTISASIPAAVIGLAIYRGILRKKKEGILESNIIQTIASAGESLAAGIIFTLPALVIVGLWKNFEFWPTTLTAIAGGLLGVVFMIPLRRSLIVESKELKYPEGVACAAVLTTGSSDSKSGLNLILGGLGLGALFKFLTAGAKLFLSEVGFGAKIAKGNLFVGTELSPALMSVGYIVGLNVSIVIFIGGAIAWIFAIPFLGTPENLADASATDAAWTLWSKQIRYMGVGAMVVGGLWSIISVRRGIASGIRSLKTVYGPTVQVERVNRDMRLISLSVIFVLCLGLMFSLYEILLQNVGLSALITVLMFIASFLFVAVSSYIVGLVGSSNNPVSGMTISALLGTSAVFLVLGFHGDSAILATLGVAAVVCCAACTAGDCSQDLKTGHLLGATPRNQQWAEIIGVLIPAFVLAPVLNLLNEVYGFGQEQRLNPVTGEAMDALQAPQANLFANITKALFGQGDAIPQNMVAIGVGIGFMAIIIDTFLKSKNSKFRLYLMPMAVGIYLPITVTLPILLGGFVRHFVDRVRGVVDEGEDRGILFSSGLIAGESLVGILIALLIYMKVDLTAHFLTDGLQEIVSALAYVGLGYIIYCVSKKRMA